MPSPLLLSLLLVSLGAGPRWPGATALVVKPENSYNSYDFTIAAALLSRGWTVTDGPPDELTDPARLARYDLVVTNLKRSFTPAQVAGLTAYVTAGGGWYGNWGGPMACPELLALCGLRRARSVYLHELVFSESPLTAGLVAPRWAFPAFAGHLKLDAKGSEMVAFDQVAGTLVARDVAGNCLGTVQQVGQGRAAVLGFCPSNYRFLTDDSAQAAAVLDNLLSWLLPAGPRPQPLPSTVRVCLPRGAVVTGLAVDGRRLTAPGVQVVGSLATVTVPLGDLAVDQTATIRLDAAWPRTGRQIERWIHDPSACAFTAFDPPQAADFLATLHATVSQPLLRYEGGGLNCRLGIPGDRPRGRCTTYPGDLFADYVNACHARGIQVVGGLYLDWKRFETHLKDAPLRVAADRAAPVAKVGAPVCPLGDGVWEHNLGIVRHLLASYPDLDGVILDDNFEFDQHPCYCAACLAKFAAWCAADPNRREALPAAGDPAWRSFWVERKLAFCRAVRELCAARGKPVGGWTQQRGPLALRGVFDFAGDMVYLEPPRSVAPLWPQLGDFPVTTLLWGMNRQPAGLAADLREAIQAGSSAVGFWIQFRRTAEASDNPWSLSWTDAAGFTLTPGSLAAIERSFGEAEQTWRDYYQQNLIQGDPRYVVAGAQGDATGLTLTVRRQGQPAPLRVAGAVDLTAWWPQ
ncbi:MAG: hypothetical protein IT204_05475 [Fimbriimonadaceae bacterium]|nr:hypothetical protein [Fimbriimonadaceae bacterium]